MDARKRWRFMREKLNDRHIGMPLAEVYLPITGVRVEPNDANRRRSKAQWTRMAWLRHWHDKTITDDMMFSMLREAIDYVHDFHEIRRRRKHRRKFARMRRNYGPMCRDYFHPNCVVCAGWGLFLTRYKVPLNSRVMAFVMEADGEERSFDSFFEKT